MVGRVLFLPRKSVLQKTIDRAVTARKDSNEALREAAKSLIDVVALYKDLLITGKTYERMQAAQGLERLSLRYDAMGTAENGVVTVLFKGSKPIVGEAAEDKEATSDVGLSVANSILMETNG